MSFLKTFWHIAALSLVYADIPAVSSYTGSVKDLCLDGSVRIPNVGETGTIHADLSTNNAKVDNPCIMRIETCSACHIEITPQQRTNFEFMCKSDQPQNTYCPLGCDYLHIFDMYYMKEPKTARYYKAWDDFKEPFVSESSNIFIMLCHGHSGRYNFTLDYKTKRKLTEVHGTSVSQQSGFLMSPYFPKGYYENHEVYEYVIQGLPDDRILLVFDDWHLATSSALYYEDGNNEGSYTGASLRPSIVTETNILRFMFHTGEALSPAQGRNYMGFKASYYFKNSYSTIHKPITNCKGSGYFMNTNGGHIEFTYSTVQKQWYDCVWVVKKRSDFNKIYLKITALKIIGVSSGWISIRSGLTSDSSPIANISVNNQIKTMTPLTSEEGFYIRLKAQLSSSDTVEMAYASYTDRQGCHRDPNLFECHTRVCISNDLKCDGYDHCGDNSDEDVACGVYTPEWDQTYQHAITVGVIVPMVISVFLVLVICLLFVLIRRCRRQSMEDARSTDRIRTLSEDVSPSRAGNRRRRRRRRRLFNATHDRDNPPTYDEAIQSPPSWYLNVGFSTPVDPNSPQPPPYSEVADNHPIPIVNAVPNSPASSHSSQSEVTIDSRRHSISSSSSDGGFRGWNSHESDTEGRRGRLGRHVSSSDDSDDDGNGIRISRIPSTMNPQDESQTGMSGNLLSQNSSVNHKQTGSAGSKSEMDKVKSSRDKDEQINSVVDSSRIDDSNKVGAEVKQDGSGNSQRRTDSVPKTEDPTSSPRVNIVQQYVPSTTNNNTNTKLYKQSRRPEAHAGVSKLYNSRGKEVSGARPSLEGQRRISRSDGNLATQNQLTRKPAGVVGDSEMYFAGNRHSVAGHHSLPTGEFDGNLVVDVDTNNIQIFYNDEESYPLTRPERSVNPVTMSSEPYRSARQDLSETRNVPRNNITSSSPGHSHVSSSPRFVPGSMVLEDRTGSRMHDVSSSPSGEMGRTASVSFIPLYMDGDQEEDIYV